MWRNSSLPKGRDVNSKDNNSQTPLHLACARGHPDVVELLLAKSADVNAKDSKEQTALSLAKEQGHEEIVGLFCASTGRRSEEAVTRDSWLVARDLFCRSHRFCLAVLTGRLL